MEKGRLRPITTDRFERIAPGVVQRKDVDTPCRLASRRSTLCPIGRGQRELIIGDRQTGKTALAIDTIINQKGKDLFVLRCHWSEESGHRPYSRCPYTGGTMEYTTVVGGRCGRISCPAIHCPLCSCAIGEEFLETGRDALVYTTIYPNISWAYRQVSLLLRRPPGREAYPGRCLLPAFTLA